MFFDQNTNSFIFQNKTEEAKECMVLELVEPQETEPVAVILDCYNMS